MQDKYNASLEAKLEAAFKTLNIDKFNLSSQIAVVAKGMLSQLYVDMTEGVGYEDSAEFRDIHFHKTNILDFLVMMDEIRAEYFEEKEVLLGSPSLPS